MELLGGDALAPGHQLEAQEVGEGEGHVALAVVVDAVSLHLQVGAVAQAPSIMAATSEEELHLS
jgi:hypothetical protein